MRLLLVLAAAVALAGCGGSDPREPPPPAAPSPVTVLNVAASIEPAQAGTPERPQGVTLDLALELAAPDDVDPPLATRADVTLPAGVVYDGTAVAACPRATLARRGPRACPAGAIVGEGTVGADADTSRSKGTIAVVNGGPARVFLYTALANPVRVQAVVPGTVRDGRLRLTFPEELQVVAGVPLALRHLTLRAGSGTWLATTACPEGMEWAITAAVVFDDGSTAERTETQRCAP